MLHVNCVMQCSDGPIRRKNPPDPIITEGRLSLLLAHDGAVRDNRRQRAATPTTSILPASITRPGSGPARTRPHGTSTPWRMVVASYGSVVVRAGAQRLPIAVLGGLACQDMTPRKQRYCGCRFDLWVFGQGAMQHRALR